MRVELNFTKDARIATAIKKVPYRLRELMREKLEIIGQALVEKAQGYAPKKTTALEQSIKYYILYKAHTVKLNVGPQSKNEYDYIKSMSQEFGRPGEGRVVTPKEKMLLAFFWEKVNIHVIARSVKMSTIPAAEYMRKTFDEMGPDVEAEMQEMIDELLDIA